MVSYSYGLLLNMFLKVVLKLLSNSTEKLWYQNHQKWHMSA